MVLTLIWALRLSAYLAWRNLPHGEDPRYQAMRTHPGLSETTWRVRALLSVFYGQGLLIVIISTPIWLAMLTGAYTSIGLLSFIGAILWLIGADFEAISDAQLARFRAKHATTGVAQRPILGRGLWRYSRHPNYFGNACLWWGLWLISCQAPYGWISVFHLF